MTTKPQPPARLAGPVFADQFVEDANDWTGSALALRGPAPFLDPFARARRAAKPEVKA